MNCFTLYLPLAALVLIQGGCASIPIRDHGPPRDWSPYSSAQRPLPFDAYPVSDVDDKHTIAELVILQGVGEPHVHVSLNSSHGIDPATFSQRTHPSVEYSTSTSSETGAVVHRAAPVEASRWLAVEQSIWRVAHRHSQIKHQSVGRGFGTSDEEQLSQHAMRQTIHIRLGRMQCSGHRKFYQEATETRPNDVERYIADYRRRHNLPVKSPFGIEVDRVREHTYLIIEEMAGPGHRVSLHRSYAVLGRQADSELVESSLMCHSVPSDMGTLGRLVMYERPNPHQLSALFIPAEPLQISPLAAPHQQAAASPSPHRSSSETSSTLLETFSTNL